MPGFIIRRLGALLIALPAVVPARLPAQAGRTSHTLPAGTRIIPTLYRGDRFFAATLTRRGDSLTLFLDTGDLSRVWERTAERLGMQPEPAPTIRGPLRVASLPPFNPARTIPTVGLGWHKVIVTAPTDHFDSLMSVQADGQLGANWFGNRAWTMDYPGRRLLLHEGAVPRPGPATRTVALGFPSDQDGLRIGHSPNVAVVIDGDSLNMLFDTGATVWPTDDAAAAIDDGAAPERAVSLAAEWLFKRWRERHPDWQLVDSADVASGLPLLRVPNVQIAGFDSGPVWFRQMSRSNTPPPPPRPPGIALVNTRISGTIGGNVLRGFSITVDYLRSTAHSPRGNES